MNGSSEIIQKEVTLPHSKQRGVTLRNKKTRKIHAVFRPTFDSRMS
jgi:hypothetical protein